MMEQRPTDYPRLKDYEPTRFMLETSHYDEEKADRAVRFIENLCHTKGKWAGHRFWLLPWQERIIRDVFGVVDDNGYRQFRTAYVEIPKKNGKQLALDTLIPTPTGFTTMGDLCVGDLVFDERGFPCHVVAKSEVDDTEQAYKLTFRDGSSIIAGARHLWNCEYIHGKRKAVLWTSEEIYRRQKNYGLKKSGQQRSVIRIPVCDSLQLPDADLPVDPYLYGYWLGNGVANRPDISVRSGDVEDIMSFIPYSPHNRYPQTCGGSEVLVYHELKKILVPTFRDKVIRPEYLRASESQRWALLQGLMDSDGSIGNRKGQSVYVSTILPLALSVRELLWSLGIKNAIKASPSTRNGWPTGEILYTIRFTTFDDQPTSRLIRKAIRQRIRRKKTRSCFHYLKSIEPVDHPVKMQCIQVDSPSHQYLAGKSMVPTHNSELAAAIALYLLYADNEPSAEVYGAAADRQQGSIVFDVARRMVEMSPALLRRSKIMTAGKRLVNYSNAGFYQVLSAEVGCVAPETIIQLKDGSMKRADQVVTGDVILSFNGQIPVFDEVVSAREEEPAEMFCITTHHGRQITVTENHPFFRMERGYRMQDLTHQYDWAYASTLMTNDRVAVGLGWPYVMNPHSDITSQEAWALGAWAGDGDCTRFRFINPDSPVIAKLRTYLESIGSGLKSVFSTRQIQAGKDKYQAPVEHLITGQGKRRKSPGREWIRENYGQEVKCQDKVIPERVLKGGPQIWAAFLAGYFDTDGCITNPEKGNAAFICSVSNTMLVQLQLLLARLGINASHWRKLKLSVSGRPQLRRLWSLLSPYMVHQRKRERLEQIASKEIYCLQRASESDKIKSVIYVGKQKSISFEMRSTQTHCTNGLITHNTKHGLNVSGLVLDELHAQPNRNLVDVLTKGSGDARTQPFYFLITTAGTDRNSICYEYHSKASDILAGKRIDPSFYPVIFGLEDGDDWNDEANWYKANPSLGQTIQIDRVRDAYREALQNPAEENVFRQLRLDQWVGSTVAWIPEHIYDKGARHINLDALKGRDCYAGLDLSSTSDITAFVMVFPPRYEGDDYIVLPHFWLPRETLKMRVRRDHVPYDVWEKQGMFHVTEGNVVDYNFVRRTINELGEQYHILEIGVDRWNATQLITDLEGDGFTMVPIGMGFKDMSPGMKELYKLLLEGKVNHGGNPVLRWMAGNVVAEVDAAENIKPSKKKSTEKIDGIVALIMGLDRAVRHEQAGSVYDQPDRGLVVI